MALHWNVENVKDYKTKDHKVRDLLIWGTMFVGINQITEKNWKKFYARHLALEKLGGAMRWETSDPNNKQPYYIQAQEVKDWIGLYTNASNLTDAQFKTKLFKELAEIERTAEAELVESK